MHLEASRAPQRQWIFSVVDFQFARNFPFKSSTFKGDYTVENLNLKFAQFSRLLSGYKGKQKECAKNPAAVRMM